MHKLIRLLTILVFFSATLSAAQVDPPAERILLTFIPNVQFAPFYLGIEQGIFAEAGFDLSLEHLQEPEVLDLVAVEQANFGVVSGEQVILARAQGRDVIYVFEWFQQYPVGLVFAANSQITALADLRGSRVGIPGRFGASYSGLTSLLHSAELGESDVELSEIGFNAPAVFCLGVVDAAVVYINNEPLQIRQLAEAGECGTVSAVDVISVASQVDLVSNGLIVSRGLFDDDPDTVSRMVGALTKALRTAINNPAAAYLASVNHVENLPAGAALIAELESAATRQAEFLESAPVRADVAASREVLRRQLEADLAPGDLTQMQILLNSIELWDADRIGFSDLSSWQAMRDTLTLMGFLDDSDQDLPAAFTNQFIAESDA